MSEATTSAPARVSLMRLYLLRAMYLVNFALVGTGVGYEFIHRVKAWDQITGAAFSFWAALSILSALGIRYPLTMLPIVFMQLCYKVLWFPLAYLPLQAAGRTSDLAAGFLAAIAADLIVIPWPYVAAHYFKNPGERWTPLRRGRLT